MLDQRGVECPIVYRLLQKFYGHRQIPHQWKGGILISKYLLPNAKNHMSNENLKVLFLLVVLKV